MKPLATTFNSQSASGALFQIWNPEKQTSGVWHPHLWLLLTYLNEFFRASDRQALCSMTKDYTPSSCCGGPEVVLLPPALVFAGTVMLNMPQ